MHYKSYTYISRSVLFSVSNKLYMLTIILFVLFICFVNYKYLFVSTVIKRLVLMLINMKRKYLQLRVPSEYRNKGVHLKTFKEQTSFKFNV